MSRLSKLSLAAVSAALIVGAPAQASNFWASQLVDDLMGGPLDRLSRGLATLSAPKPDASPADAYEQIAYRAAPIDTAAPKTISDFVDYRPFANDFIFSVGKFAGDRPMEAHDPWDVTGTALAAFDYGTLDQEVTFDDAAPFIGIGFDAPKTKQTGWDFQARAGAAVLSSGDLSLRAVDGSRDLDPALLIELQGTMAPFGEQFDNVDLYPVVQMELKYRF
ncbi:MAG: hypothetical protein AAGA24_05695 [Pseudomonadota bacterium]